MKNLIITFLVMLCLALQANGQQLHESSAVVSAMLTEPYIAALLSLVLLIATLI
ncbi:MAG: hypothetical protein KDD45_14870 [Bdellovibrionales bacterium]|nr:hypothetical protein [Bdellovibrionales bacterium]